MSRTTPKSTIATAAARLIDISSMPARWPKAVTPTPMTANENVRPTASISGPKRLPWNAAAMTTGRSGSTHGLIRVSVPAT